MTQKNRHDELEIFLDDLTSRAKKEVLNFLGYKTEKDGNLDVFPIATIPKPEPDEELKLQ
jgi:abortive infection bacteriophage resistance protein